MQSLLVAFHYPSLFFQFLPPLQNETTLSNNHKNIPKSTTTSNTSSAIQQYYHINSPFLTISPICPFFMMFLLCCSTTIPIESMSGIWHMSVLVSDPFFFWKLGIRLKDRLIWGPIPRSTSEGPNYTNTWDYIQLFHFLKLLCQCPIWCLYPVSVWVLHSFVGMLLD